MALFRAVVRDIKLGLAGAQHSVDVRPAQAAVLAELNTLLQRFKVVDTIGVRDLL
ncbi:MAG TPA: hypothetical protein VF600_14970 [Abditibacteriaceae bacterium]